MKCTSPKRRRQSQNRPTNSSFPTHAHPVTNHDSEAQGQFLRLAEVARLLRVSPKTIPRYVKKYGLPGIHIGKRWLFRRDEVEAWLTQHSEGIR